MNKTATEDEVDMEALTPQKLERMLSLAKHELYEYTLHFIP